MNCNYKVKITDIQTKYKFKVFCTGYDDSEIKEKIDAMYQAWPKATAEGETPTLDNTANATMSIDLKGNTSQETTTGKNLLPITATTQTINGVTFTKNQDGTITANGTATDGVNYYTNGYTYTSIPAGTYTLSDSLESQESYNTYFTFLDGGPDSNSTISNATFTLSSATNLRIRIVIRQGTTLNNIIFKPMLRLSSITDDTYEPYTNGASPNPDYPQDVHVVTGDNTINICGKNLFDDSIVTNQWSNYSTQEIIDVNGANLHKYECKQGDTYTLSATFDSASGNGAILIQFFDKEGNSLGRHAVSNNTTLTQTRTAPANTSYAYIGRYLTTPTTIQLEKNTQATTYEAYTGASYPVNLGSMELCKIGDYQDYIYKEGKKWYKYGAIGKIVLDGTQNITLAPDGIRRFNARYSALGLDNIKDGSGTYDTANYRFCDHFIHSRENYHNQVWGVYYTYNGWLVLYDTNSVIADATALANWFSNNNTSIYYVLATPTTTEITDATLISQLNALAGAESYSGQTNISQTNDDKPFILTAKALKDLSNL